MSNSGVMDSWCSEWDDSSQTDVIIDMDIAAEKSHEHCDFLEKLTRSSSKSDMSLENIADLNYDHLVSEVLLPVIDPVSIAQKFNTDVDDTQIMKKLTTEKPRKVKLKFRNDETKTNCDPKPKSLELPSVYSKKQIARHNKRMSKLKALEQNESESETESEPDRDNALDRDLDINLRIFEESVKTVDKIVIGEIQCNILHETSLTNESCDGNESDPMVYSDNDSDMEILVSKPIIRKRPAPPMKKERPSESKQKLTMYDLIHDHVLSSPDKSNNNGDLESKEESKYSANEVKKMKPINKNSRLKKEESSLESVKEIDKIEEKAQHLPVPKLKVGADGEVVIDMDSLVIEQTGVSEARNALANSEVIEECGLSYTSYGKKCSYRKQWTPHETLKFYQVLSTIGTDFTLMATLFPGRTRKCMKRKFKREEKCNSELIMKALSCKQNFNLNLLEKELQLKDEKLNQFKENNKRGKKQKISKKKQDSLADKKETKGVKRRSFFQSSVSSFRK